MSSSVEPDHLARGERLFEQGRFDLAVKELRAATAVDPTDPHAPAMLAMALTACEKGKEALSAGREAVRRGPDVAFSHTALGYALWMVERVDDAALAGREALRLDAQNVEAHLLLAALADWREDWPAALKHARDALFADPTEFRAAAIEGEALIELGRIQEAINTLRTSLRHAPEDSELHRALGRAYLKWGQAAAALSHLRESLRLDPNSGAARAGAAEAMKARSRFYGMILRAFLWCGTRRMVQPALLFLFGVGWLVATVVVTIFWEPGFYVMAGVMALGLSLVIGHGLSVSFFDLLLLFDREGRWLLTQKQTDAAWSVAACLVAAAVGGAAVVFGRSLFLVFVIPTSTIVPWLAGSILRSPDGPNRNLGCRLVLPLIVAADAGVLLAVSASSFSLGEAAIVTGMMLTAVAGLLAAPIGLLWILGKERPFDPTMERYLR